MEDLALEALIADVVANPTPERVPCEPAPIAAPPGRPSRRIYRSIRSRAGAIVRRIGLRR